MVEEFSNFQTNYEKGKVFLVGAGPGDVGLLTIRAASVLHVADVIVYDGLINNALLQFFPRPQKIYCGKKKNTSLGQENINQLLVKLAQKGQMVIRLKGGDPIVFARGSEEALYLKAHNIPFEIIPGVTSGYAVAAYAGIPVTDRNLSSVVVFVTGQKREDKEGSLVDWKTLALIEGSLVVYMGVKRLPFIIQSLIEAGKLPTTLVSVIEAGTLPRQKVIQGTLATIIDKVGHDHVESPAIIVIGEVNKLREKLDWFDQSLIEKRKKIATDLEMEFARNLIGQVDSFKEVPTITYLKHGGDIQGFAQEARKNKKDILDFSSNINPLGISPMIEKMYRESLTCILEYPDPFSRELCEQIAAHFLLDPENVIAGNGAISLIDLTIRALRPKRALLIEPCFNEYRRLLQLYGAHVQSVFLKEENNFNFSYEDIRKELDGIDMIVLGYPNNPTGTMLKKEEVISLIQDITRRRIFLLIDEAFIDWNPSLSVHQEIKGSPFVIVVRSMTKFFGLAGIRAGFAFAQLQIVRKMRAVQEPWSCSSLAQRLSIAALRDVAFQTKSLKWFKEESKYFFQHLSQLQGIKFFPSLANFFLGKLHHGEKENGFWEFMKSQGIYLRPLNDITGLNHRYFRVALKDRPQNLILIEKFKEVFIKDQCLFS